MPDVAYLDSSAIVKTIVREAESTPLRQLLRSYRTHASAALARTEVIRAVRRAQPSAVPRAFATLEHLLLISLDDSLLDAAGVVDPPEVRTLDAVHLAAARALAADVGAFVTYDERMVHAGAALGFPVCTPGT